MIAYRRNRLTRDSIPGDTIPVFVQPPNKPHLARSIGWANRYVTPLEVAAKFGIQEKRLLHGRIIRHRGKLRWIIVMMYSLLMLLVITDAQAQQRTFYDSRTGKALTRETIDSQGARTIYDATTGRVILRSTK